MYTNVEDLAEDVKDLAGAGGSYGFVQSHAHLLQSDDMSDEFVVASVWVD